MHLMYLHGYEGTLFCVVAQLVATSQKVTVLIPGGVSGIFH